jgi:uncharacterized protein YjbI with pentapeptide repeats
MPNTEDVERLKQGVNVWNDWRREHPYYIPDLSAVFLTKAKLTGAYLTRADLTEAKLIKAKLTRADLTEAKLIRAKLTRADLTEAKLIRAKLIRADLTGADLTGADLTGADLTEAKLISAKLTGAKLGGANLVGADLGGANLAAASLGGANLAAASLTGANLTGADLTGADLTGANLTGADLTGADLTRANLSGTTLIKTNFEQAILEDCRIYGISAWNINLKDTLQSNLIITPDDEATITVDNLQVAQFIYLLLNNTEIRAVIDTITSKAVLILGRFTDERKEVLDALRNELRKQNYLPILFDFEKPSSRDLTETIVTLASMSRFIIADITDPKSIPQELMAIVPTLPSAPVQPIILRSHREWAMFEHLRRYPWMLDTFEYDDIPHLLASIASHIIAPAEAKAKELKPKPLR